MEGVRDGQCALRQGSLDTIVYNKSKQDETIGDFYDAFSVYTLRPNVGQRVSPTGRVHTRVVCVLQLTRMPRLLYHVVVYVRVYR